MQDMAAVYFLSPSKASVDALVRDCLEKKPMYRSCHVFFSSRVPQQLLNKVVNNEQVVSRLAGLKEVNLEVLAYDPRSFLAGMPAALRTLYGDGQGGESYGDAIERLASRLATVFVSLNEMPNVRFRVGRHPQEGDPVGQGARNLVCQRLALSLVDKLQELARQGILPTHETCDLLLLDRMADPLTPLCHDWTYEGLVYDLLDIDNNTNVYKYQAELEGGRKETKQATLNAESDKVWAELRHLHIGKALSRVNEMFQEFSEKNKAAQLKKQAGGALSNAELDTKKLKNLVQALPEYQEQLARLSLHIDMAHNIDSIIQDELLDKLGLLEEGLVFGEAKSEQLVELMTQNPDVFQPVDKLRLLALYCACFPNKLDSKKK